MPTNLLAAVPGNAATFLDRPHDNFVVIVIFAAFAIGGALINGALAVFGNKKLVAKGVGR